MPCFSIIIPAYNNAQYLPKCIQSLREQTLSDWEAIIVVDGSPDDAARIAFEEASKDSRIHVIDKPSNEGTHLARKTGTLHATGDYSIFLDADDELIPSGLEQLQGVLSAHPVDILHFGTQLFGEGISQTICDSILRHCNIRFPTLRGKQIPQEAFVPSDEDRQDWRVLQRAFNTKLLKRSFALMTDQRLGRGQDSYEWLVISSQASIEENRNDIIAYRYYLGRGITNVKPMSADQCASLASNFMELVTAAQDYANRFTEYDLSSCVSGLKEKLLIQVIGDWYARVPTEEKEQVVPKIAQQFGLMETAAELMRLALDDAYAIWDTDMPFSGAEAFMTWIRLAEDLVRRSEEEPSRRFLEFQTKVRHTLNDLNQRSIDPELAERRHHEVLSRTIISLSSSLPQQRNDMIRSLIDRYGPAMTAAEIAKVHWQHPARAYRILNDCHYLYTPKSAIHTVGIYYFRFGIGGAERVTAEMISLWLSLGYRVVLFTDWEPEPDDYPLPDGVDRVVIPNCWEINETNIEERTRSWTEALTRYHIDTLVYCMWTSNLLPWDMQVAKMLHIPFLVYTHSTVRTMFCNGSQEQNELAAVYRHADGIIALSENDALLWKHVNKRVWTTINPPTIPLSETGPAKFGTNLIWVGRLSEEDKQPSEALEIMALITRQRPDARLLMVGPAPSIEAANTLKKRCEELNISENVVFTGERHDIVRLLGQANIFLMTSRFEGYPLALNEAKFMGLPCVMYELPYLTLSQGNRGILAVEQGNREAAADASIHLLRDRMLQQRLAQESLAHAQALAGFDFAAFWTGIFHETAQGSPERTSLTSYDILIDTLLDASETSLCKLQQEMETLRQERDSAIQERNSMIHEREEARNKIDYIHSSTSWRVGSLITAMPRKIKDFILLKKS